MIICLLGDRQTREILTAERLIFLTAVILVKTIGGFYKIKTTEMISCECPRLGRRFVDTGY